MFPAKYRYIEALHSGSDVENEENATSLDVRLKYDLKDALDWIKNNDQLLFLILVTLALLVSGGAFFISKTLQKRS